MEDPPCQKELPKWVAIDWFQTIEVEEGVWDMEALELLKKAGVRVWVVSYAGKVQGQRVFNKCDWLAEEGLVGHCTIVARKTGWQGKVAEIQRRNWGISHIFDDNYDIIKEAQESGLEPYHISKRWGYGSLTKAVKDFLAPCLKAPQVFAKKT